MTRREATIVRLTANAALKLAKLLDDPRYTDESRGAVVMALAQQLSRAELTNLLGLPVSVLQEKDDAQKRFLRKVKP